MGYRQRPFRTTASNLITGEVEDGSRHNPFANEVAQFEVGRQQLLGLGVDLSLGVIGDGRRVEEVEEAVVLDGLCDGTNVALRLVLLLLLHRLDGHVLSGLPVDGAAFALEDLGALEAEGVLLVGLALHLVLFRQLGVGEEIVGCEEEVNGEALEVEKQKLVN